MKEPGFYDYNLSNGQAEIRVSKERRLTVILDDGTEIDLRIANDRHTGPCLEINKDTTTGKRKWLVITPRASNAIEVS